MNITFHGFKMTTLNNVKTITLNGNSVEKIAQRYIDKYSNKERILVTDSALKEALDANIKVCEFDFNKQHEIHVIDDSVVLKDMVDTTYKIKFVNDEGIVYTSDSLTDSTEIVYLAGSVWIDDVRQSVSGTQTATIVVPEQVNTIFVSRNISGLKFTDSKSAEYELYYPNIDLTSGIESLHAKIIVDNFFDAVGLSENVDVNLKCKSLLLKSKFFKNVLLNNASEKMFGNFGTGVVSKIYVERDGLNTTLTNEALLTKLKTVLNATDVEIV